GCTPRYRRHPGVCFHRAESRLISGECLDRLREGAPGNIERHLHGQSTGVCPHSCGYRGMPSSTANCDEHKEGMTDRPGSFHDFEQAGWEKVAEEYDRRFGELTSQSIAPLDRKSVV